MQRLPFVPARVSHPNPRALKLNYYGEYPLSEPNRSRLKHVPLRSELAVIKNLDSTRHCSFPWYQARLLENRLDAPADEGVWGIDHWRVERRIGNPGSDVFPRDASFADVGQHVLDEAKKRRLLFYFRIRNADDAVSSIRSHFGVRYATALTSEWYDPVDGIISVSRDNPEVIGTHALPLDEFADSTGVFRFPNSWGTQWGDNGYGTFDRKHFEHFLQEAWLTGGMGFTVPLTRTHGVTCLEWKWSCSDFLGVHVREIVDAATSDRLAWAFCVRKHNTLDIEEFFVWPTERNKGYARELARMVRALAHEMALPLRLLVSFADSYEFNLDGVKAVARLLDLHLSEADEQWVHLFGIESRQNLVIQRPHPQRPAVPLEWLRPKDEAPITVPTDYVVLFGTDRRPVDEATIGSGFSGERDTKLLLGSVRVQIPTTFRFGSTGRVWHRIWSLLTGENRHLLDKKRFDEPELFGATARLMAATADEPQNLLYVHGFNVSFDAATRQAAQFAVDLKIPGATFLYSWPSASKFLSYPVDEATIDASCHYFEHFLRIVLEQTENTPLSIIVHSMGSRAVVKVIQAAGEGKYPWAHNRIRQLIFAAPDVDSQVFVLATAKANNVARQTTLYVTRADLALHLSEALHGYPRAGLSPPVVTVDGIDTVLVEGFNLFDLGHGYYAEAAAVMHDIFNMIHHNASPAQRPRIQKVETTDGRAYWKLPLV